MDCCNVDDTSGRSCRVEGGEQTVAPEHRLAVALLISCCSRQPVAGLVRDAACRGRPTGPWLQRAWTPFQQIHLHRAQPCVPRSAVRSVSFVTVR